MEADFDRLGPLPSLLSWDHNGAVGVRGGRGGIHWGNPGKQRVIESPSWKADSHRGGRIECKEGKRNRSCAQKGCKSLLVVVIFWYLGVLCGQVFPSFKIQGIQCEHLSFISILKKIEIKRIAKISQKGQNVIAARHRGLYTTTILCLFKIFF